jgi:hypothetical protein
MYGGEKELLTSWLVAVFKNAAASWKMQLTAV